ncbi:hypothetical protein LZ30DRAFT_432426 [Colletotrichum cereale]|nr:hypothetical protein LZ30DRAFT_432426 [Colletotrichum cereale]
MTDNPDTFPSHPPRIMTRLDLRLIRSSWGGRKTKNDAGRSTKPKKGRGVEGWGGNKDGGIKQHPPRIVTFLTFTKGLFRNDWGHEGGPDEGWRRGGRGVKTTTAGLDSERKSGMEREGLEERRLSRKLSLHASHLKPPPPPPLSLPSSSPLSLLAPPPISLPFTYCVQWVTFYVGKLVPAKSMFYLFI